MASNPDGRADRNSGLHRKTSRSRLRRAFTGRFRWWTRAGIVLLLVIVALGVDVLLVSNRIKHFAVVFPSADNGQTYVIVGSDSRADLPSGASGSSFGSTVEVPGQRADVVLVVHVPATGPSTTLSIPRDLLVVSKTGGPNRLTLTFDKGQQDLVDSLCQSLGIAATHLIVINFAGFTAVINALGGVTVTTNYPLRDQMSGLLLTKAGTQRIDGDQALSLIRSRHTEQLIDGEWAAMSDGALQRTSWAGVVFAAVRLAVEGAKTNPVLLQRVAWTGAGALTTDSSTGLFDLIKVAEATGTPVNLPASAVPGALAVTINADTRATLASAGFGAPCS